MKQRTRPMHHGDDQAYNMMHSKKEDDDHEIQLHNLKPQENFIEAQVQEGDTLQAIALRFHCSISELKRINHIHKDNEIYAKRTVKIPITPYSVLTELIPTHQRIEPVPSTSNADSAVPELTLNNISQPSTSNTNVKDDNDCSIDCNAVVLNSTLAPAIIPYTDVEPTESVTEDSQLLPNKEKVCMEAIVVKQLTSHGADFGLKWYHLVCFVLILGVCLPLWIIIVKVDKPEFEHPVIPPLQNT